MNTIPSGTKASGGDTYLNGIREDICGRYFETDPEYPVSDYIHVGSRYTFNKGTQDERIVYDWELSDPIITPAYAKIELDTASLNNMEYVDYVSGETICEKGQWYNALITLENYPAFIEDPQNDPQINEIMAAKPLSTLKEHIANVHIYGRHINDAIGLAIEPGTDIYYLNRTNDDVINAINATELTALTLVQNNKYFFSVGYIQDNGFISKFDVDYGQSIDEYDITADHVRWNKEAMSLDNYQQLPSGMLLSEAYTINFIWHVSYGYDKHRGDNLGIARDMIREALVEKGADISGIGELKLFSHRTEEEGEDPISGPLVLVDNTGKKFGLAEIDIDRNDEDFLAAYLHCVTCPFDEHAITDGTAMYIESQGSSSYYSGDPSVMSHESIINAVKNTVPYDELYEINVVDGEEPITLPDCADCAIYLEKY